MCTAVAIPTGAGRDKVNDQRRRRFGGVTIRGPMATRRPIGRPAQQPRAASAGRSGATPWSATWPRAGWPSSSSRARRRWAASRSRWCSKLLQPRYAREPARRADVPRRGAPGRQAEPPDIVHVYDVAEDGGLKYIAMEYIHGETLADIVKRGLAVRQLPAARARRPHRPPDGGGAGLRARAARARRAPAAHRPPRRLAHEHPGQLRGADEDRRLRHRARPGRAARGVGHRARARRRTCRPSRCAARPADYRSDIFSLGIILYELTLCQRLYRGPRRGR